MSNGLLPPLPALAAFVLASLVLALTPGPGVIFVITRSLSQGRSCGLASAMGLAAGNFMNAAAASIGLAALFAVASVAFDIVKYAGAAYLIFLGIRAIRSAGEPIVSNSGSPARSLRRTFFDALIVACFNPKTTLFAAFLPQFLRSRTDTAIHSLALGLVFVLIAAVTDSAYGFCAGSVKAWPTRSARAGRVGKYATGSAFIGLGLFAALAGHRR